MRLTKEIAYPIIQKLTSTMNYNINIMDDKGVIIASSDPKRVDSIHEGAIEVHKLKQPIIIKEGESSRFLGTKEGVNLPIDFMNEWIGVVGITGKPDEVIDLAQMTKITVELMLQQAYLQQQAHFEQQQLHSWILDLINPDHFDEEKLIKHAKHFLKIDFEKSLAVILVEIPSFQDLHPLKDLIRRNELLDELNRDIKTYAPEVAFFDVTNEDLIVIGIAVPRQKTEIQLAEELFNSLNKRNHKLFLKARMAIGGQHTFVKGIRQSYFESRQSLTLMKKFNYQKNISHIGEWGLIRLLDQVPSQIRQGFQRQYKLEKLPFDLLETLQTLFDCDHNLTLTAEKLHIHRNTLTYRLENVHQITKLNPKSINDATLLNILLILRQLGGK